MSVDCPLTKFLDTISKTRFGINEKLIGSIILALKIEKVTNFTPKSAGGDSVQLFCFGLMTVV